MHSLILPWLAALPVLMVFNRIRGGGMSSLTNRLPSRALFYVSTIVGGLVAAILDPLLGLIVGIGFAIWGAPGWGLWFDLHEHDEQQKDDPRHDDLFVKAINSISFGSDYVAMFWRLGLFVLPMLAAWCYLENLPYWLMGAAVWFAIVGVGCYELKKKSSWGNLLSELLVGAVWWVLILFMATAHSLPWVAA